MDDEQSAKLSQDMFDAKDDAARIRVAIHWLPVLIRCLMKTAGRVKLMLARLEALEQKVDEYHSPKTEEEEEPKDPRLERLRLILAFAQRNWQGVAIVVILAKALGLLGDLTLKDLLPFLN